MVKTKSGLGQFECRQPVVAVVGGDGLNARISGIAPDIKDVTWMEIARVAVEVLNRVDVGVRRDDDGVLLRALPTVELV